MPQILMVTGAHRSGTSVVTSWLKKCGLVIDCGRVMPAGGGNIFGHFEDVDFVEFHIRIIEKNCRRSKGWVVTSEKQRSKIEFDFDKAQEIVTLRNARSDAWGWKDPRSALFLDEWRWCIPSLNHLFVWRKCSEVVDSLVRRSKMRPEQRLKIDVISALKMWTLMNTRIVRYSQINRDRAVIVRLSEILDNDLGFLSELCSQSGLELGRMNFRDVFQENHFSIGMRSPYALLNFLPSVRRLERILREMSWSSC